MNKHVIETLGNKDFIIPVTVESLGDHKFRVNSPLFAKPYTVGAVCSVYQLEEVLRGLIIQHQWDECGMRLEVKPDKYGQPQAAFCQDHRNPMTQSGKLSLENIKLWREKETNTNPKCVHFDVLFHIGLIRETSKEEAPECANTLSEKTKCSNNLK